MHIRIRVTRWDSKCRLHVATSSSAHVVEAQIKLPFLALENEWDLGGNKDEILLDIEGGDTLT